MNDGWSEFAKRVMTVMKITEFLRSIEEWEYPNGWVGIFRVKSDESPTGQATIAVLETKESRERGTFYAVALEVWQEGNALSVGRLMATVSGVSSYNDRLMEGVHIWRQQPEPDDARFQQYLEGTL